MLKGIWFLTGFVVAYFVVIANASTNAKVLAVAVYVAGMILMLANWAPTLGVFLQGSVGMAVAFWLAYRRART